MSFICSDIEAYPEADACVNYVGGMSSAVVVKAGVEVDTQSESEVQNAIDAGDAALIENVIIGLPEPSAVTQAPTIACETDNVVTYDRTVTMRDGKVIAATNSFYDALNNTSGFRAGQVIVYQCAENRQLVIDATVKFQGGLTVPESDTEYQVFNFTGNWRSKFDPDIEAVNPIFTS